MTNKEYLEQVYEMDMNITYLLEKRNALKASLLSGSVGAYGGAGGFAATPDNRSFEKKMEKYILLEEEIDRQIDELTQKKEEIEKVISRLSDYKARTVLLRRYINGVSYEQIADDYGYTKSYVCYLARNAIPKLKIPQEYKT